LDRSSLTHRLYRLIAGL